MSLLFALSHEQARGLASTLLALAFLGAGIAKLSGQPMMTAEFTAFGYPLWFLTLTGALEVLAAALVLVPRLAFAGASLIVCIMIGALFAHLTHGQFSYAAVPAILLALAAALASLRAPGRRASDFAT